MQEREKEGMELEVERGMRDERRGGRGMSYVAQPP